MERKSKSVFESRLAYDPVFVEKYTLKAYFDISEESG
jgi:hypothetical protein